MGELSYTVGDRIPIVTEETVARNKISDPERAAKADRIMNYAIPEDPETASAPAQALRYGAALFGGSNIPASMGLQFLGEVGARRKERGAPMVEIPMVGGPGSSRVYQDSDDRTVMEMLDTPTTDENARIMRDYIEDSREGAKSAALLGIGMKGYNKFAPSIGRWIANKTAGVGRTVLMPRAGTIPEEAKIAQAIVGEFDSSVAIPQLYPKGSTAFVAEVVEGAVGGAAAKQRLDLRNIQGINRLIMGEMEGRATSMSPTDFGETLVNTTLGTRKTGAGEWGVFQRVKSKLYDESDAAVQGLNRQVGVYPWFQHLKTRLKQDDVKKLFNGLDIWDEEAIKAGYKELRPLLSKGGAASIPLEQAIGIQRKLNTAYGRTHDDSLKAVIGDLSKRLDDVIQPQLKDRPDVAAKLTTAKSFYSAGMDRLNSDLAKSLAKKAQTTPDAIASWFFSKGGLTRLKAVEKMFTESGSQVGLSGLTRELYEESFLKPLRFQYLQGALDRQNRFVGEALEGLFAPANQEVTEHLFGKEIANRWKDLGTALKWIEQGRMSSNIAIKLIQGGYVVRAGMLAASGWRSSSEGGDGISQFGKEGAIIFLSPVILSKLIMNPKFIRVLTDGVSGGPASPAFHTMTNMLKKVGTTKVNEWLEYDKLNKLGDRALKFYTEPQGHLPVRKPLEERR